MSIVGWTLAILGIWMIAGSMVALIRANRTSRIPYWSKPHVVSRSSLALRSTGMACLILGAIALGSIVSYWAVALPASALLPIVVMVSMHNHRVDKGRLHAR